MAQGITTHRATNRNHAWSFVCALMAMVLGFASGVAPAVAATPLQFAFDLTWGDFGSGAGEFTDPKDIALDSAGLVYVVEYGNDRFQKFTPDGKWLGAMGNDLYQPEGIAIYGDIVYVADTFNDRIQVYDLNGNLLTMWGTSGYAPGQFQYVPGIDVEGGFVYTSTVVPDRVSKFTTDGTLVDYWGGPPENRSDLATCGLFSPEKIDVDSAGNIFVADQWNNRIIKIIPNPGDPSAECTLFVGSGLDFPLGVVVDNSSGNVFVADTDHNVIKVYDPSGTLMTQFGSPGPGDEQFTNPIGMVIDPADGAVYVADWGNSRVQRWVPRNGKPRGTNRTVTTQQDASYAFEAGDFGFRDTNPTGQAADTFKAVKVTSLPGVGWLTKNGNPVAPGDLVDVSQLGQLVFTPVGGSSGVSYADFTFQVQDNSGGANDLDPSPNRLTIDVTPAAPPPSDNGQLITSNVRASLHDGGQASKAPVFLSWTSADGAGGPPLLHQIQRRVIRGSTPGPWANRAFVTGVQSYVDVAKWRKFQYQVRTQDLAGVWGPWAMSSPIKLKKFQEGRFARSSGWTLLAQSDAMGRRVARSSSPGATATFSFMGNGVALVAPTGAGYGSLQVCLDPGQASESCRTVDLGAFAPNGPRRLVANFGGLAQANHVLRVTVVSGSVSFDAAIITRA